MIKYLINIFCVKYIMDNIYTQDKKIAKERNFAKFEWYAMWVNPEYLYENKYVLCLALSWYGENFVSYENLYKRHRKGSNICTNLPFNKFPDDLDIAIAFSRFELDEYYIFLGNIFENFTYELCYEHLDDDYYLYLIRRKEEFKSII